MRALVAVAILATACGPNRTTMARYPTAAPAFDRTKSDAKAVELADKVIAAAGGMDKWNAIKQLRWGETVNNDGKAIVDEEQAWDRWNARQYGRLFQEHSDVVVKRELYGTSSDAFAEVGGRRQTLPPKDAEMAAKLAQEQWQFASAALCMPFLLEEPGSKLTYGGLVKGENGDLEVVTITFDPADTARTGTTYQVDIDPKTNMIERLQVVKTGGNLGYKLSGWTDVNGLKFPTVANNIGLATEVINFKNIKISDVEESLFVTF